MRARFMNAAGFVFSFFVIFGLQASEPTLEPGWPVQFDNRAPYYQFGSLNTMPLPGIGPVLAGATIGEIRLYTMEGELLPGWPVELNEQGLQNYLIHGPKIGDMNGDGLPELAVRYGSTNWIMNIQVYRIDGEEIEQLHFQYPVDSEDNYPNWGSPVFLDLNQDGEDELLFTSDDSLYAYQYSGEAYAGFPWPLHGEALVHSAPVVLSYPVVDQTTILWDCKWAVHARELGSDEELPGFPVPLRSFNQGFYAPLAVTPTGDGWKAVQVGPDSLRIIDQDGNRLSVVLNIDQNPSDSYYSTLGDLDGDSQPDVLFKPLNNRIQGYRLDGTPHIDLIEHPFSGANSSESIAMYKTALEDTASIFQSHNYFINQYILDDLRLLGWRYTASLPGFPIEHELGVPGMSSSSCALIQSREDSLYLVQFSPVAGLMWLYNMHQHVEGMVFEWPVPGGYPHGNAVYNPVQLQVSVTEHQHGSALPSDGQLHIYPNPSNAGIMVSFEGPGPTGTTLQVFNVLGELVREHELAAGGWGSATSWHWNGLDERGNPLSSGIYLIRLAHAPGSARKVVLLR